MNSRSSALLLVIIVFGAIVVTIGYINECNTVNQELAAPYRCTIKPSMIVYNPTTLKQLQQLFQSDDQQCHEQNNDAISLYKKTLYAIPQISRTLVRLSKAYAEQTTHDDAMAAYNTAHTLNPSNITSVLQPELSYKEKSQDALNDNAAILCDIHCITQTITQLA